MKSPEERLTRGTNAFINCTDYDEAIKAMKEYAIEYHAQQIKELEYSINENVIELNELKEAVRRNLIKNDISIVNIIAVGHNLIRAYESKDWSRVHKKIVDFIDSYNYLITEMNKKETPFEDRILELEAKIELLKKIN